MGAPLAKHPWCTVLTFDPGDAEGSLTVIRDALAAVLISAHERNRLTGVHGVDNWAAFPPECQRPA
jgi:hypothetical protein